MDRPGIEKLTRRVVGPNLADDVDFDKVAEAMEGYMPAFVKEALNRAVRYSLAANGGRPGKIGTQELLDAADGLRDQLALMESAPTDPLSDPLSGQFHRLVAGALDGFKVMDAEDETYHRFTLAAANGHGE